MQQQNCGIIAGLFVDIFPMADCDDEHPKFTIHNLAEYPVFIHAVSP